MTVLTSSEYRHQTDPVSGSIRVYKYLCHDSFENMRRGTKSDHAVDIQTLQFWEGANDPLLKAWFGIRMS
jgi:hypothetical protein